MRFSAANLPVGAFGAVMGLAGLGLAARAAAPLFPGVFRAPAYFTEPWLLAGLLAFLILIVCYLTKLVRHPAKVREDFSNPATMGFSATLPVAMTLVAGGITPYWPAGASALWWLGVLLLASMMLWGFIRILRGGIELAQINAGWMILLIGGIVVPGSGIGLGHGETARFLFGASAAAAPLLMAIMLYRAAVGPALPEAMRPSWFILLVPPSLIYAHGTAFYPDATALENLFFLGLILAAALLVYARGLLRWPFGPAWWAFTFPLDALAYAAVRYAQEHPGGPWRAVAGACLLLATGFVVLVLVRQLGSLAATPRSAASPRR